MIDPTDLHSLSQQLGERYNATADQRARILERLRSAGPSGVLSSELAAACDVPCVTKRISELRRKGHPIKGELEAQRRAGGKWSGQARYWLAEGTSNQPDLFA